MGLSPVLFAEGDSGWLAVLSAAITALTAYLVARDRRGRKLLKNRVEELEKSEKQCREDQRRSDQTISRMERQRDDEREEMRGLQSRVIEMTDDMARLKDELQEEKKRMNNHHRRGG